MEPKDYTLPNERLPDIIAHISTACEENGTDDVEGASPLDSIVAFAVDTDVEIGTLPLHFETTLRACQDFYLKNVEEDSDRADVEKSLEAAWHEEPRVALRLIFQLRDIRRGKGLRIPFLICLVWLRSHHLNTLLYNLQHVYKVGCWKDLLELLVAEVLGIDQYLRRHYAQKNNSRSVGSFKKMKLGETDKAKVRRLRKDVFKDVKGIDKHEILDCARKAFAENPEYRMLHVRIASIFATTLKDDLASMQAGRDITMACKWAPSTGKRHDRFTLVTSTIAQLLFPRDTASAEHPDYVNHIAQVRLQYHSIFLTPLRAHIEIAEKYMSDDRWDEIKFKTMPVVCTNRYKHNFKAKGGRILEKYIEAKKDRKKAAAASTMKPHELVRRARQLAGGQHQSEEVDLGTIQAQWDAHVRKLEQSGALRNCLAVCDVSSIMQKKPSLNAAALSLLAAERMKWPFRGMVCTFSTSPELFCIPEGTLDMKVTAFRSLSYQQDRADIEKILDLILKRSRENDVPKIDMIKRLLILSALNLSDACNSGQTSFQGAKERFLEAGYELPEIVFWNLSARFGRYQFRPVVQPEDDTVLVSGHSRELLELFMERSMEHLDSNSIMIQAIQPYDYVRVID